MPPRSDPSSPSGPGSPSTATRTLVQNLTLPPLPNFDIPPSPPGSPPPGTDAKFAEFLALKARGVHFNEKLARSSALRNPSLLKKLMDFAGLEEHEQYATVLPRELWDPLGWPEGAYKEELARSSEAIRKKKEAERVGRPREFVAASGPESASASGQSSRVGTPGVERGVRASAAERVAAGLDGGRVASPQSVNLVSRGNGGRRPTRFDDRAGGRSRSPGRRKRSRSR
jgi:hypothetical protein